MPVMSIMRKSVVFKGSGDWEQLSNRGEDKQFLKTALAWSGSVTPKVLPRVTVAFLYASGVATFCNFFPQLNLSMTPFEYSGSVLTLLLVSRVNAGLDRWWEARKIWGSIVNQSRNLALAGFGYSSGAKAIRLRYLAWVASWPHVMRESLRNEKELKEVGKLLGEDEVDNIRDSNHMPTFVGFRIIQLIRTLRNHGLDNFAFQIAERERALLIDAIGACERIRNTPIPLVLAIKMRRFILLFLLLLPFGLFAKVSWITPLVVALASYPLFSLDEIGAELQNPFSPRNLSHFPLEKICQNIEGNVMSLGKYEGEPTEVESSKSSLTPAFVT
jgi:putative membrane protein